MNTYDWDVIKMYIWTNNSEKNLPNRKKIACHLGKFDAPH